MKRERERKKRRNLFAWRSVIRRSRTWDCLLNKISKTHKLNNDIKKREKIYIAATGAPFVLKKISKKICSHDITLNSTKLSLFFSHLFCSLYLLRPLFFSVAFSLFLSVARYSQRCRFNGNWFVLFVHLIQQLISAFDLLNFGCSQCFQSIFHMHIVVIP